jgi:tetratricopeptide (TPR) repeat protein
MRLIDGASYADAEREFDLAIQLSPRYSRAFTGKALALAYQKRFDAAFETMKKAWKNAETRDEKFFVHVAYIRINTLSASECLQAGIRYGALCKPRSDWLELSRREFDAAVRINPRSGAPYYFMGLACKTALNLRDAAFMFSETLRIKDDYVAQADQQWQLVQKIQRAMPGTLTGKKIAFVEELTRADAAALFMEELKIDALYKKRGIKTFDTSFKDPEKAGVGPIRGRTANDIARHPLKADIEGILQLGVRGLEVFPDGAFRPNEAVDRASYAMMIEDILIKITGDNALATLFIGEARSSFPDLRTDIPYYNAVRVVTSRGIMGVKNIATGEFSPRGPVGGADALLAIRSLIDILKIY